MPPTPFATVEVTLPPGLQATKASGVTSFTPSEDGDKVRLRLASSTTFSLEGTGLWHKDDEQLSDFKFVCHDLMVPTPSGACNGLGASTKIASLWESGYMMHVLLSSWQVCVPAAHTASVPVLFIRLSRVCCCRAGRRRDPPPARYEQHT